MRPLAPILLAASLTLLSGGAGAGGDVTLVASQLDAENINITAARHIKLVGLAQTDQLSERRSGHSGSFGVGVGRSAEGASGIYITLSGSRSLGHGRGDEALNAETELAARNTLTLKSGQDTNLTGARVSGNTVKVDAGGRFSAGDSHRCLPRRPKMSLVTRF